MMDAVALRDDEGEIGWIEFGPGAAVRLALYVQEEAVAVDDLQAMVLRHWNHQRAVALPDDSFLLVERVHVSAGEVIVDGTVMEPTAPDAGEVADKVFALLREVAADAADAADDDDDDDDDEG